jgi:hypothetical protein
VLYGFGFDATTTNDTVSFDHGVTGSVTGATETSMTLTLSGVSALTAGTVLHANVTVDGAGTSTVQQATVIPAVTATSAGLPANSGNLTINGFGFDTNTANDSVSFDDGVTGAVTAATGTTLTVSLTGLGTVIANTPLHVVATVDAAPNAGPVEVGVVTPIVTTTTSSLPVTGTTLTINGFGFDPNTANDTVTFTNGSVSGVVTSATGTTLTVKVTGFSSLNNGTALDASVGVDGLSSGAAVQVGTVYTSLSVANAAATPTGVVLTFNLPLNPATTVLYSNPGDTTLGPANIVVTGPGGAAIRGSLIIDATNPYIATFVQTSGLLTSGTYTVTVGTGVQSVGGLALSTTYTATLSVTAPTTPVLSVPGFARGPGQTVQITDSSGNDAGIPIGMSQASNVTQVGFSLTYDPTLLTIPGAFTLSAAATRAGLSITSYAYTYVDAHHEVLSVALSGGTGFTATTAETLLTIEASVPSNAVYRDKSLLNLTNVVVNSVTGAGVSGVDVAAYPGDASGDGGDDALGASLVDQVGSGAGTGFSAYQDLDPSIIGAVSGDGFPLH